MRFLITILIILECTLMFASETHVFGKNQTYANQSIEFYTYSDPITKTPLLVETCKVRPDGTFKGSFDLNITSCIYIETGIYHLYFYAEPDEAYQLLLPKYTKLTEAEILNPFLEPKYIHVGIKDLEKNSLNYLIMDFDYFFDIYLDENMLDIFAKGRNSDVDVFIKEIDEEFPSGINDFFDSYKKYSFAMLRHIAYERKTSEVAFKYFRNDSIWYSNPAYSELFNKIYENFLDNELLNPMGSNIYKCIAYGHSIKALKKVLSLKLELKNDQFKELVILKGIHDAFYNENFAWTPLLLTLDSLCIATAYPKHREIGQNIADKILNLSTGTVAPAFTLSNYDGEDVSLETFRNEFIYLSFINTNSYTSLQELELLKVLHEKHQNYFRVVTVVTDENSAKAKQLFKQNAYDWTVLYTSGDKDIVNDYKVLAFPTYYLIGPAGELILSPAPSPLENFERIFFTITQ